ncbi:MAG TPA: peptidylprolyl isomerase [Rhizomicrobium sp.]|nr:peptidylprolyl isomerase [Rhizomicrobium sp.]
MHRTIRTCLAIAALALTGATAPPPSMNDILAHSPKSDWHLINPANTLVMSLPHGRVTIQLAPAFAPNTVTNILKLVHAHYFDGSFIVRAQDNYVVQWARNDKRPLGSANATIPAEFDRWATVEIPFHALPDPDTYARETGFSFDFPAARDAPSRRIWLTHCYGMVGVGRDVPADSGNGTELYAVIGQAPRHLDRNVTLVGRVIDGMELLSVMPRGTGPLGFYQKSEHKIPIAWIRLGSDLPPAERPRFEALNTGSRTFAALLAERRARPDPWFKHSPGRINVCNVPLPVRRSVR